MACLYLLQRLGQASTLSSTHDELTLFKHVKTWDKSRIGEPSTLIEWKT